MNRIPITMQTSLSVGTNFYNRAKLFTKYLCKNSIEQKSVLQAWLVLERRRSIIFTNRSLKSTKHIKKHAKNKPFISISELSKESDNCVLKFGIDDIANLQPEQIKHLIFKSLLNLIWIAFLFSLSTNFEFTSIPRNKR